MFFRRPHLSRNSPEHHGTPWNVPRDSHGELDDRADFSRASAECWSYPEQSRRARCSHGRRDGRALWLEPNLCLQAARKRRVASGQGWSPNDRSYSVRRLLICGAPESHFPRSATGRLTKHPRRGCVEGGSDRQLWCADNHHIAYRQASFNVLRQVTEHKVMPKKITLKRRKQAPSPSPDHQAILARRLDQLADAELQHGHHLAAERLAWRAAALREGAR